MIVVRTWVKRLVMAAVLAGPVAVLPGQPAVAAPPSCTVGRPVAGEVAGGTRVALAAGSSANATRVDYTLDGAHLGRAVPTGYGWLYSPDNGASYGWDSTTVANGPHTLRCVATAADGSTGWSAPVTFQVTNATGCVIAAPAGTAPVTGARVAISAGTTVPNPTKVELFLHSATAATVPLGAAFPSAYGWLYSPDGGASYGWNSTAVSNGIHRLTCVATTADGVRHTSPAKVFTVDNTTPQQYGSFCADHQAVTPADYQAAWDHRRGGWAGADGAHQFPLPDGRVLWLFGDTLVGTLDAANALGPGWRMPSNSALVQSGTCFTPVLGGPPGAPAPLLPASGSTFHWPGEGFVDTAVSPAVLRLSALAVHAAPCGFGWEVTGVRLFTLSLPDLRVVSSVPAPFDATIPNVPSFGRMLLRDGEWTYLYGEAAGLRCTRDPQGGYPAGRYAARVRTDQLTTAPWTYWDGGGWNPDVRTARAMTFDGLTRPDDPWLQGVVRYGGGYLATGKTGALAVYGTQVYAWRAAAPSGPWQQVTSGGQPVNLVPAGVTFPQGRLIYGGRLVMDAPGTSAAAPMLVFSTNGLGCGDGVPCTPDNDVTKNVTLYGPRAVAPVGLPPPA